MARNERIYKRFSFIEDMRGELNILEEAKRETRRIEITSFVIIPWGSPARRRGEWFLSTHEERMVFVMGELLT